MRSIYSTLTLLSWTVAVLAADNATNHIFQPAGITDQGTNDQNRIYVVGKEYPIKWATSTEQPYVVALWQTVPGAGYANNISEIFFTDSSYKGTTTVNWTCSADDADLTVSNIFYVELRSDDVSISSHYFNITKASSFTPAQSSALASSITSATATSTSSGTTSATASSTTSSAATSSAAASSSAAADSTATKVGLGVGLGIGIPLVAILAIWAGFSIFRRRAATREDDGPQQPWHEEAPVYSAGVYAPMAQSSPYVYAPAHPHEKANEVMVQEVPGDREPVELPSENKPR